MRVQECIGHLYVVVNNIKRWPKERQAMKTLGTKLILSVTGSPHDRIDPASSSRCGGWHAAALLLILLISSDLAPAATITWTNSSDGVWSQAANWSPNQVPGEPDSVLITQPGTYSVTLDVSTAVQDLTIGAGIGQQRLTNHANTLVLTRGATVEATGFVDWAGPAINGPGGWEVRAGGIFTWAGETSPGFEPSMYGSLTILSGGVLNVIGETYKVMWGGSSVTNHGTVNWLGAGVAMAAGAVIVNEVGGVFNVQCDGSLGGTMVAGTGAMINYGIFRKSAGTGATIFNVPFTNFGTILGEKGSVHVNNQYWFSPTSRLRFKLSGIEPGIDFGQVRFATPWDPTNGVVSGEVAVDFHPPSGAQFQVISGGLVHIPFHVDRNAGNGYVFDYFRQRDTFTFVIRPATLTLPPRLSLLHGYPGTLSLLMEGQPDLDYRLLSAEELNRPTWPAFYSEHSMSGLIQVLVTNLPLPHQFYRAVTP
jgi:hypothetical protein